ncbi:MAG: cupin domain-containing protein [Haliea sp.]|jgi:hypothetical protein|nr:cupin domain-containing protein [Haliea sp.]
MTDTNDKPKFQIFRVKDAKSLEEEGNMSLQEFTPEQMTGIATLYDPELARGDEVKVLFNIPGFNLTHVWFKKNYPLPRHSHDCDCLYYIIAGSLRVGTEELGPRDGFFISANVPYTYTPGPEGVELLEFRHATAFDFKLLVQGAAFWARAADTARANSAEWRTATMPPLNV